MIARSAPTHKYTADPPHAGLGNCGCHTGRRGHENRARSRRYARLFEVLILPAVACRIGRSVPRKDQVTGCGSLGCEFGSKPPPNPGRFRESVKGSTCRPGGASSGSLRWAAAGVDYSGLPGHRRAPRNVPSQLSVLSPWTKTTVGARRRSRPQPAGGSADETAAELAELCVMGRVQGNLSASRGDCEGERIPADL
jgi:hypothetical protein